MVDNLAKFNTFVKEKKLKVERALKTEMEEKTWRQNMTVEIGYKLIFWRNFFSRFFVFREKMLCVVCQGEKIKS